MRWIKGVYRFLKDYNRWKPDLLKGVAVIRLGSEYGGWYIPKDFLTPKSICYLAGAGEDISFDIEVIKQYDCAVKIIDPTPRALDHFKRIRQLSENNLYQKFDSISYKVSLDQLDKVDFISIGLWNDEGVIKFYEPKNPDNVSHSAMNLQKTERYFEAPVTTLSSLMKLNDHVVIDLLKLDIEGAEYKVIESMVEDRLHIKVLCVEFDEAYNPIDENYIQRIKDAVNLLEVIDLVPIFLDYRYNITFANRRDFDLR